MVDRGYPANFIASLTNDETQSFCGVGNPIASNPPVPGERVLDIGCGVGIDMIYASHFTDKQSSIFGTELSPEMAVKARLNCTHHGFLKDCISLVENDQLPFDDMLFDQVISNGVLNLSPQKEIIFSEIYRVLQKGGKLSIADIFLENSAPQITHSDPKSWAQ